MRVLRGLGGALLWIVASLLGLVGVILCVTVILLPVGIPLLGLARRMFGRSIGLILPRAVAHPVDEGSKQMRKRRDDASTKAGKVGKKARKLDKASDKKADKLSKKGGKGIRKLDKATGKKGDEKLGELAKKGGKKVRDVTGRKKKRRLPW